MKKKPHGSLYVAYVQDCPETANPSASSLRVLCLQITPINSQLQLPSPTILGDSCSSWSSSPRKFSGVRSVRESNFVPTSFRP